MKKILFVLSLMAMVCGSAWAQNPETLKGKWSATQDNVTLIFNFDDATKTAKTTMVMRENDPSLKMDVTMTLSMNGTYTYNYPSFTVALDRANANLDDIDIKIPGKMFTSEQRDQLRMVMWNDASRNEVLKELPETVTFTIIGVEGNKVKAVDETGQECEFTVE